MKPQFVFTLLCDDVRVEVGNRLSLMGVFHNLAVEQLPVSLIKLAVVSHWAGQGIGNAEVRILTPDRAEVVVASDPATIDLSAGGFTYNLTLFVNVVLQHAGTYWVQTLLDSEIVNEHPFLVASATDVVNGI